MKFSVEIILRAKPKYEIFLFSIMVTDGYQTSSLMFKAAIPVNIQVRRILSFIIEHFLRSGERIGLLIQF